jgi:hypothetical protein
MISGTVQPFTIEYNWMIKDTISYLELTWFTLLFQG